MNFRSALFQFRIQALFQFLVFRAQPDAYFESQGQRGIGHPAQSGSRRAAPRHACKIPGDRPPGHRDIHVPALHRLESDPHRGSPSVQRAEDVIANQIFGTMPRLTSGMFGGEDGYRHRPKRLNTDLKLRRRGSPSDGYEMASRRETKLTRT